jgi:glutaredoxin 3
LIVTDYLHSQQHPAEEQRAMSNIEIYTRPGCHYCAGALKLLQFNQLPYREYDVYVEPQRLAEMRGRTQGITYPQIFINDVSVGGFDELLALKQQAKLPETLS